MTEELRKKAKELLKSGQVSVVIGYRRASDGIRAAPAFITREEDAGALVWDSYCVYNLAGYLKDFPGKKIGIVVKSCDAKAITVLLQENQLKREDVFIIGVECAGIVDEKRLQPKSKQAPETGLERKCRSCQTRVPAIYDYLVKEKEAKAKASGDSDVYEPIRKLEAKSLEERLKFWQAEFSRCIRCYACRQVCPMCYCPTCVADQTMPAWFSKATGLKGNFSWNVTRAMHLAGRCIDCGECERACPVGISLRDLNKKIEKDIKELFGYEAGSDVNIKPLLASFDKNDPDDFIR